MARYLGGLTTTDETQVKPANNYQDTSGNAVLTSDEQLMLNKQSLYPTAGNTNPTAFVENLFSVNTYVGDGSATINDKLHSEAFHNINGEIGIDIVLPDSFSIFLIYERNQAIDSGHTDKVHIAIGYLPNKETNYAFKLEETDGFGSEFKISKNINDFEIDFKLNNQDILKQNTIDEATINLKKIF